MTARAISTKLVHRCVRSPAIDPAWQKLEGHPSGGEVWNWTQSFEFQCLACLCSEPEGRQLVSALQESLWEWPLPWLRATSPCRKPHTESSPEHKTKVRRSSCSPADPEWSWWPQGHVHPVYTMWECKSCPRSTALQYQALPAGQRLPTQIQA